MSLVPNSADSPVIKIGAVVVRVVASHQSPVVSEEEVGFTISVAGDARRDTPHQIPSGIWLPPKGGATEPTSSAAATPHSSPLTTHYEFLIIQPIPKNPGEVPHFVLPRGSRQYRDASGAWVDARDVATAEANVATLEPFARGLTREIEEEAGIGAAMLARCSIRELGGMAFQSRTKGVYPIHWFVVMVAASDAQALAEVTPVDAMAVRWASLDVIRAMAAAGTFSAGYVPVIEAALGLVKD